MGKFTGIGLLLLIITLVLVNFEKVSTKINIKWIFWVSISFFGNGFFATVQKYHQIKNNGEKSNEMMILALTIVVIAMTCFVIIRERNNLKKSAKYLPFAAGHGVLNGIGNMCLLLLAPIASASLVYPLATGCNLVLLAIISFLFYKEKLKIMQWVGVVIGIISALLLSI